MKYKDLSKNQLIEKIKDFEKDLKSYVDRVDERYRVFYERNLAGIYRSKLNGEILDCNNAFAQILGYSSKEDLIGTNAKLLYNNVKDRTFHLDLLNKKKFVKNRKLALQKKDGSDIWVSISTSAITNPSSQEVEYFEGTIIDITELISTQQLLSKSEQNYKLMLNESPYGILIHENGIIKYFNNRAEDILKKKLNKNDSLDSIFPTKVRKKIDSKSLSHFNQIEISNENSKIFLDVYAKEVLYENKDMIEYSFVDVQDRVKLEEERIKTEVFKGLNDKLKLEIKNKEEVQKRLENSLDINIKQSAKLEAIIENRSHIIWTSDEKYRLTSFNQNFADLIHRISGYHPKIGDNPITDYTNMKLEAKKSWEEAYRRVFNGESVNFVSNSFAAKSNPVYTNVFLNPILNNKKEVIEISGIGHDITDKVLAEQQLNESLKEKDILLKEVHHRVKNNLQVISSIFNLQSSFSKDEKIRAILKESQNRIKSMAYIHESLYKSSQFGKIYLNEYLKMLCNNLLHSYTLKRDQVSLLTEIEIVELSLDLAIPCGLIVNEIVSNSLKHAFNDKDPGIISIQLKSNEDEVKLRLIDDGIGIPDRVIEGESGTLGFQLIETLVEQIGGKMEIDNTAGTSIYIKFPLFQ